MDVGGCWLMSVDSCGCQRIWVNEWMSVNVGGCEWMWEEVGHCRLMSVDID